MSDWLFGLYFDILHGLRESRARCTTTCSHDNEIVSHAMKRFSLLHLIIRRFASDDDIVHVAFPQTGAADADET